MTFVWLIAGLAPSSHGDEGGLKDDPMKVLSQEYYYPWLDYTLHDNNLLWTVVNNDIGLRYCAIADAQ